MSYTIADLLTPGAIYEIRTIERITPTGKVRDTHSGFFSRHDQFLSELARLESTGDRTAIYWLPQPLPEAFAVARVREGDTGKNRVVRAATTVRDEDITDREWLLLDVDPVRPTDTSSTQEELDGALALARTVATTMTSERGWPTPVLAVSGNGAHLMWRCRLAAKSEAPWLRAMEARFEPLAAGTQSVDTRVGNPARIWKAYGTTARKGSDTPERPHRVAQILELGDQEGLVTREQIDSVIADWQPRTANTNNTNATTTTAGKFSIDAFVARHFPNARRQPHGDGGWKWRLEACPWSENHSTGTDGAAIFQTQTGKLGFKCHHNSCADKSWVDVREKLDPSYAKSFVIGVDTTLAAGFLCAQLAKTGRFFRRGKELVAIDPDGDIAPVNRDTLTLAASDRSIARWYRPDKDGDLRPCQAPKNIVAGVVSWPSPPIPRLVGVVPTACLTTHGILDTHGFDRASGLYLADKKPTVPATAIEDIDPSAALDALADLVCDFPFVAEADKSAWLALVLTLLARRAITAVVPAWGVTAPVAGTGKTLLAQIASLVAYGKTPALTPPTHDDEALAKQLLATARAGSSLLIYDNVRRGFGGFALELAITGGEYRDRILGSTREVTYPWTTVVVATGNNLAYSGDMARRVCEIRLDANVESPENRKGFRYPSILAHAQTHAREIRSGLLRWLDSYRTNTSASASASATSPTWGSFEAWSELVRGAIVSTGRADPYRGQRPDDPTRDALGELLTCWYKRYEDQPVTSRILAGVVNGPDSPLGAALQGIVTGRSGANSRTIGYALRKHQGRIVGGLRLNRGTILKGARRYFVSMTK